MALCRALGIEFAAAMPMQLGVPTLSPKTMFLKSFRTMIK